MSNIHLESLNITNNNTILLTETTHTNVLHINMNIYINL